MKTLKIRIGTSNSNLQCVNISIPINHLGWPGLKSALEFFRGLVKLNLTKQVARYHDQRRETSLVFSKKMFDDRVDH